MLVQSQYQAKRIIDVISKEASKSSLLQVQLEVYIDGWKTSKVHTKERLRRTILISLSILSAGILS